MCATGGTPNARVTFKGDPWLFGRVFFPCKGAVRHTPLKEVGTRNSRVGTMMRDGKGLHVGVIGRGLVLS